MAINKNDFLQICDELDHHFSSGDVRRFLAESLGIEGIRRGPTSTEILETIKFLRVPAMTVEHVCNLQAIYAPDMPLRDKVGMNVRVGNYIPPVGRPDMATHLRAIVDDASTNQHPYITHQRFEQLHPFMDGNGRTGRALWAWQMLRQGRKPFSLPFLHRWYYQSLEHSR